MDAAKPGQEPDTSELFLLRLWTDGAGEDGAPGAPASLESKLHGKVMHVLTGQGSNFNDWPTLLGLLTKMMSLDREKDDTSTAQEGATT